MPKFKKGDKVTYHRGKSAVVVGLSLTVNAKIDEVVENIGGLKMDLPLYHISWSPKGKACVRESQLS